MHAVHIPGGASQGARVHGASLVGDATSRNSTTPAGEIQSCFNCSRLVKRAHNPVVTDACERGDPTRVLQMSTACLRETLSFNVVALYIMLNRSIEM